MRTVVRRLVSPVRRYPSLFITLRELFHPGPALYQHLYFNGPFKVELSDRVSFKINHHGFEIENDLFWAGFGHGWEGAELRLWRALAQRAEFVADIGANTGVFSLAAAALNPRARIIALEPVPRVYKKLVANVDLNSFDVCCLQIAASDADGEAILFDTAHEHTYSASLDATMLEGNELLRVPVRTTRLDSLFDQLGWPHVDLVKIDVEKHEPAVLTGMQQRLAKDHPTLLIEVLNGEIGAAISKIVRGYGYRFFAMDQRQGLVETATLDCRGVRNYLLCAAEHWQMIGPQMMKEFGDSDKAG